MAKFLAALLTSVCLHAMLSVGNFAIAQLELPNEVVLPADDPEETIVVVRSDGRTTEQLPVVLEEIPIKEVNQFNVVEKSKLKSKRPRFNKGRKRYHRKGELRRNGRNGHGPYGMRYHDHENDDSRLQWHGRELVNATHLLVPLHPQMPRHHHYKMPLPRQDTLAGKAHTGRKHHHNGKRRHHRGRVHRVKDGEDLVDSNDQTTNSNMQVDGIGIKGNPDTM
ncbi:hypothetical protein Bpfe_016410 [Biomphalaria pfeifferi]|uniref:Uncharacterized protein n=1 Tax=Biomphalaria pfeifferi TaxID=112525 RepID=A0AAD8BHM7_BIOPF|nr:hypothetical protein Bpfe_016410 [Biomphalaria pfeifferi]